MQFNKATGKKTTLNELPSKKYPGNGAFTLTDGVINKVGFGRSSEFIGFEGNDASAIIDLGAAQKINTVAVHTLESAGSWIYAPKNVEVLVSTDGKNYTKIGSSNDFVKTNGDNGKITITFSPTLTRYIKTEIKNAGKISEGKPGAGERAWLFVDEIEVM